MTAPLLFQKREALRAVRVAVRALTAIGRNDDARRLHALARELADDSVALRLPCVVCRERFPVSVAVDHDHTPDVCLCVECDALIQRVGGGIGHHVKRDGVFVNGERFVPGEGRERGQ
jgi:hypothetical protein